MVHIGDEGYIDAEADMLFAEARSAICVQRFDDSRNSAIHTTYRISLRSSSLREPRYPLLRVVLVNREIGQAVITYSLFCILKGCWLKRQAKLQSKVADADIDKFTVWLLIDSMILPQVHLRKPCYDFSFLYAGGFNDLFGSGQCCH